MIKNSTWWQLVSNFAPFPILLPFNVFRILLHFFCILQWFFISLCRTYYIVFLHFQISFFILALVIWYADTWDWLLNILRYDVFSLLLILSIVNLLFLTIESPLFHLNLYWYFVLCIPENTECSYLVSIYTCVFNFSYKD